MQRLHKGGFISCCLIRKSSYHTHRQHHQRLYQLYQHHWYQSYASLRLVFPNLSLISLSFYLNHPLTKKKRRRKAAIFHIWVFLLFLNLVNLLGFSCKPIPKISWESFESKSWRDPDFIFNKVKAFIHDLLNLSSMCLTWALFHLIAYTYCGAPLWFQFQIRTLNLFCLNVCVRFVVCSFI
jgi:hypothetical protein